ncbi:MAG: STAS domain-containing protein [Verrucomicrobiota bacterium]
MDISQILVFAEDQKAIVKVVGKGSFQNAHQLKSFYLEIIPKGTHEFDVDLQDCTYLDSTFLGTLALLGSSLRKKSGHLNVINANARNMELMQNLGLDRLFTIKLQHVAVDTSLLEEKKDPSLNKLEAGQQMLEAHQMLIEVDSKNLSKFKDVVAYLKEDLGLNP